MKSTRILTSIAMVVGLTVSAAGHAENGFNSTQKNQIEQME